MTMAVTSEKSKEKGQAPPDAGSRFQLSGWMLVWFYVTAVVCTWDATFIMLRPYTLPGGHLAKFWYLYKYYITVDRRYMDISDAFVFAQSLLNYGEVVFNIVAIIMHYRRSRHTTTTAFMVNVMTMWKTVLYFLMFSEFCQGEAPRRGNTVMQEIFLVVIPNGVWIIIPLCAMYSLWQQLVPTAQATKTMPSFPNLKSDNDCHNNCKTITHYAQTNGTIVQNGRPSGYINGETVALKRNIN